MANKNKSPPPEIGVGGGAGGVNMSYNTRNRPRMRLPSPPPPTPAELKARWWPAMRSWDSGSDGESLLDDRDRLLAVGGEKEREREREEARTRRPFVAVPREGAQGVTPAIYATPRGHAVTRPECTI